MYEEMTSYSVDATVGIIGAGWYGSHLALYLKEKGYKNVTLLEKNSDIFSGISGTFGIRLHAGPHYPRSPATRKGCREGFAEFYDTYPELVNEHEYSIYALGTFDANGEPPKVNQEQFESVCQEFRFKGKIDSKKWGYTNLITAVDVNEPSVIVGVRLRNAFEKYLKVAGVKVECGFNVKKIEKRGVQFAVVGNQKTIAFDHVINATSYHMFLPKTSLPKEIWGKMEISYQPCLALVYKDKKPISTKPISFIVMDGWFPCLMPYDNRQKKTDKLFTKYIMTHGKWTIIGSYNTAEEAKERLDIVGDDFVNKNVRSNCEREMVRFWPEFQSRFEYVTWIGSVLVKLKTEREFRSALSYKDSRGIIQIIPGKISNIFAAAREIFALLASQKVIVSADHYRYIEHGVLHNSISEITEKPRDRERNTCELQPYKAYFKKTGDGQLLWSSPISESDLNLNAKVNSVIGYTNIATMHS